MHLRYSILFTVVLLACSSPSSTPNETKPQASAERWKVFESELLGISLEVPPEYIYDKELSGSETITFNDAIMVVQSAVFFTEQMTEPSSIRLLQSDDPRFLQYVSVDHAWEPVSIGDRTLQQIRMDGMGEPVGFLLREEPPFMAIVFVFPPDESAMRRIVQSIRLLSIPR